MKKSKYIYSFEATDKSGKKRKFHILNPSRKMREEGELFYASKLSAFISSGVLPKIVWDRLFKDSGGIVSKSDEDEYSSLIKRSVEKNIRLEALISIPEGKRSNEEKSEIFDIQSEIVNLRSAIHKIEISQINAFENTAEAKARNKTIVWWSANLACEQHDDDSVSLILGGGSIESKLDAYDDISESDEFLNECMSRINYLVTVWYLGSASSQEEFKKFDEEYVSNFDLTSAEEDETDLVVISDAPEIICRRVAVLLINDP
jgi:hypothetical protein